MLYNLRQNKATRVFIRQTFNGFITLLLTSIGTVEIGENFIFLLPFIYAGVNAFSKYVNTTYFDDVGVD